VYPLIANIADRAVDAIPGEHFWSLTFLQYHLLCPFGRGCLIDPLICEFWRASWQRSDYRGKCS